MIKDEMDRFEKRLDDIYKKHAAGWLNEPPEQALSLFNDELQAFDARLEQRLARWRGEAPPQPATRPDILTEPAVPTPKPFAGQEFFTNRFKEAHQKVLGEFDFDDYPRPGSFDRNLQLFSTPLEFLKALLDGLGLSTKERQDILANPPKAALELDVVYLPGQGCLVNTVRFGLDLKQTPANLLDPDRADLALAAIMRSHWGDGFLLEYTALGQELQASGLYQAGVLRRAGIRLARLEPKLASFEALGSGMQIAWVGWREWIWEYCAVRLHLTTGPVSRRPSPRRLGDQIAHVIAFIPMSFTINNFTVSINTILNLFRYLFFQEFNLVAPVSNKLLLTLEAYCDRNDEENQRKSGVRVRSLLGWYYLFSLEAALSSFCVPYALLIAFNFPKAVVQEPPPAIRRELDEKTKLSPNTRLALLNGLNPGARYDIRALRLAAREIDLEAPESYFRP